MLILPVERFVLVFEIRCFVKIITLGWFDAFKYQTFHKLRLSTRNNNKRTDRFAVTFAFIFNLLEIKPKRIGQMVGRWAEVRPVSIKTPTVVRF